MNSTVHSGHRERLKQNFLSNGFSSTVADYQVLEMLLFYSVPRRDTNVLAHNLIRHFGSLAAVLDADADELLKIEGVTENTAVLLKMILPISSIYKRSKYSDPKQFENINEIGTFLVNKYDSYDKEILTITSIDSKGRLIGFDIIEEGDISSVGVSVRKIIKVILSRNAVSVVMAHNHPGGVPLPSNGDISVTESVKHALAQIGVILLDHIIIADNDFVSMAQSCKYKSIFK